MRSSAFALACSMGKYLVIFNGAATDEARETITPEDSSAFVERWGSWAGALGSALVAGAPLYRKVRLTADTAEPFEDAKTAYALVDATSHDQAVEMFSGHPHLDLAPGLNRGHRMRGATLMSSTSYPAPGSPGTSGSCSAGRRSCEAPPGRSAERATNTTTFAKPTVERER